MIQSGKDAERFMQEGQPIMGRGWKEVDTFEDLDDIDEYESDDEVSWLSSDFLATRWSLSSLYLGNLRRDGPGSSGRGKDTAHGNIVPTHRQSPFAAISTF